MSRYEELATILGRSLMDQHGLNLWALEWADDMEYAGRCYYDLRLIVVSRARLFDTHPRNVRETFLHEIAHALTPRDEHGLAFQAKLREIGGTGYWVATTGRVTTAVGQEEVARSLEDGTTVITVKGCK